MKALDLQHVESATSFVVGLGGTDVTPQTLRWMLEQARAGRDGTGVASVYVPEGV